jgi:hypothetical protein
MLLVVLPMELRQQIGPVLAHKYTHVQPDRVANASAVVGFLNQQSMRIYMVVNMTDQADWNPP